MSNNTSKTNKHMHGPGGMMNRGEKAKDFKGTFKKFVQYMGGYKLLFVVVFVFAVCSTVLYIVGPKMLGKVTTALFNGIVNQITGTGTGIDFNYIHKILLILIALYIMSSLFSYLQGYIMTGISMKVTYNLRRDIAAKIQKLPFQYYDNVTNGEVLSHITNDVDVISQSLNQSITQIITSVTTLIGIIVMMFSISWQMSLAAFLVIPASAVFITVIVKKSQKYFKSQQEYIGHINGHVEEMYANHVVVKAFNSEKESSEVFDKFNNTLYSSSWKSQFLSGLMMPVMNFIGNLGYVVVCILGAYLASTGRISVGDIQAFIQYVGQFKQPIVQAANISNILQQMAAAAERIFDFLAQEEETAESKTPVILNSDDESKNAKLKGNIEFDHVKFGYKADKIIIKDFSAKVKPGQKIAIVGPTGAGKTTIVKLLMRFYDVNSGSIKIDGYDIRDFKRNDLRSMFGMVLQDTWLYNATIADNIRYGSFDATDEEVIAAAKAAEVHHFVKTLPDGYNMMLNEEASNISQGQKQLLTIARVILLNPQVLILDEATSSVDTRTEVLIQKAMDNLMKDRTSFVIAHRLSTIKNADLILVLNNGDIVEQGTHEELLNKNGFYAKLYNSQFEPETAMET